MLRHEIRQSGETGVQLPVNFRRLIWNAQKIFKCKPHRPGPSGTSAPWSLVPSFKLPNAYPRSIHCSPCKGAASLLKDSTCAGISPLEVINKMREMQEKLKVDTCPCTS